MSSDYKASPAALSLTTDLSSRLASGQNSAECSESLSTCPQAFTPNPMAKQSILTRSWRQVSVFSAPRILPRGRRMWSGLSTHITPYHLRPRGDPPSRLSTDTRHPSSPTRKWRWWSHHHLPFRSLPPSLEEGLTSTPPLRSRLQDMDQQTANPSSPLPRWSEGVAVHLRPSPASGMPQVGAQVRRPSLSQRLSTLWLCVHNSPDHSGSILPSTFHE